MPIATNWAPSIPTSVRAAGSSTSTRKPSTSSDNGLVPASAEAAAGPSIGATRAAPPSTSSPIDRNTQPGPAVASRTPASAGATSTLTLSVQPKTTFDAVSSSGTRASAGASAACVGRVTVTAVAATAAQA